MLEQHYSMWSLVSVSPRKETNYWSWESQTGLNANAGSEEIVWNQKFLFFHPCQDAARPGWECGVYGGYFPLMPFFPSKNCPPSATICKKWPHWRQIGIVGDSWQRILTSLFLNTVKSISSPPPWLLWVKEETLIVESRSPEQTFASLNWLLLIWRHAKKSISMKISKESCKRDIKS